LIEEEEEEFVRRASCNPRFSVVRGEKGKSKVPRQPQRRPFAEKKKVKKRTRYFPSFYSLGVEGKGEKKGGGSSACTATLSGKYTGKAFVLYLTTLLA